MSNLDTVRTLHRESEQTINILEATMGMNLNAFQRSVIIRLADSVLGDIVSVPAPRRSGKTRLARGLMELISDSIVISQDHTRGIDYDPGFYDRIYYGRPDIRGIRPSLIIIDEIDDISYIEMVSIDNRRSRILHMYTPNEDAYSNWRRSVEFTQSYGPSPIMQTVGDISETLERLNERDRRLRYEQEELDINIEAERYTSQQAIRNEHGELRRYMDAIARQKKEKEWDDDENI